MVSKIILFVYLFNQNYNYNKLQIIDFELFSKHNRLNNRLYLVKYTIKSSHKVVIDWWKYKYLYSLHNISTYTTKTVNKVLVKMAK